MEITADWTGKKGKIHRPTSSLPLCSRCSSLFHVQNTLNTKEAFFFPLRRAKPLLSYVRLIVKRGSKCSWTQQRRSLHPRICSHWSDTPDSHYRGSSSFLSLMTKWKLTRHNHGTVRHTGKINSLHVGLACSCTGSSMQSCCCQSGLCTVLSWAGLVLPEQRNWLLLASKENYKCTKWKCFQCFLHQRFIIQKSPLSDCS